MRPLGALAGLLLVAGLAGADHLTTMAEDRLYADEIVYAKRTPYQRIVVTQNPSGFQLFLNGALQFSSGDEYRYHESLVHPAMAVVEDARRVLVLGGGDGLAVREVLRYPQVEHVMLVDLDPGMTDLARAFPPLAVLSGDALADPRNPPFAPPPNPPNRSSIFIFDTHLPHTRIHYQGYNVTWTTTVTLSNSQWGRASPRSLH